MLLFCRACREIAGFGCCLPVPEVPARGILEQRTHHPARPAHAAARFRSAAFSLPEPAPSAPSGP